MIKLINVSKRYDNSEKPFVFSNVNIKLTLGELVMITGQSGSGKSNLLNIISLLLSPTTGSIEFLGKNVNSFSKFELNDLHGRFFTHIDKNRTNFDHLSCFDNLKLSTTKKVSDNDIAAVLEKVGLKSKGNTLFCHLSGGQKQLLNIAMVLLRNTKVILLDEPFASLDEDATNLVKDILLELKKDHLIIISTHNKKPLIGLATSEILVESGNTTIHKKQNATIRNLVVLPEKTDKLKYYKPLVKNTFRTMSFHCFSLGFLVMFMLLVSVIITNREYFYFYNDGASGQNIAGVEVSNISPNRVVLARKDGSLFDINDQRFFLGLGCFYCSNNVIDEKLEVSVNRAGYEANAFKLSVSLDNKIKKGEVYASKNTGLEVGDFIQFKGDNQEYGLSVVGIINDKTNCIYVSKEVTDQFLVGVQSASIIFENQLQVIDFINQNEMSDYRIIYPYYAIDSAFNNAQILENVATVIFAILFASAIYVSYKVLVKFSNHNKQLLAKFYRLGVSHKQITLMIILGILLLNLSGITMGLLGYFLSMQIINAIFIPTMPIVNFLGVIFIMIALALFVTRKTRNDWLMQDLLKMEDVYVKAN